MQKDSKIFVAGHRGLVGSAILRKLKEKGFAKILTASRSEVDLRDQKAVTAYFQKNQPHYVFLCAAKVGGIHANDKYRGDFIRENLEIQNNVIGSAFDCGVEKLLFMGSSCIYPKFAAQPMKESELLTGALEPTNEAYAIAKIAGLMMCKSLNIQYGRKFISVMPTNVYGPGDNYHLENSHVLPALLRKFHEAKIGNKESVTLWGTGSAFREFIYSDDLGEASIHCMLHYDSPDAINIGTGREHTIKELAESIREIVAFRGKIEWDSSKPDGTPRKLLDSSKLKALGWKAQVELLTGIQRAYDDLKFRYDSGEFSSK